jgi:heme/copper-type cytochrome/quinol oxidase subunit 2
LREQGVGPTLRTERLTVKRKPFGVLLIPLWLAEPAHAGTWSALLLPANYARHGVGIDNLFDWICWITIAVFVIVHIGLIWVLVRYRGRRAGRARFSKGSVRLELIWTIIPTLILGGLAVASAEVWDTYRYSAQDEGAANILVIGQQFKWNIIYPGKDGKFGRYLVFPKPTGAAWPHEAGDTRHIFAGAPGPASLPYERAAAAINEFVSQSESEFQLGKDLSDPSGVDDDYQDALGRTLYLPVNRAVRIEVMSRDVIHDFYLPNFRVQVYGVPGMVNAVTFTPTQTTEEIEAGTRREYTVEELGRLSQDAEYRVARDAPVAWANAVISPDLLLKLKLARINSIKAYRPAHLEAFCNQLCGVGHSLMKTQIVILSQAEYHRRFE